jgi:four helix bundle protein
MKTRVAEMGRRGRTRGGVADKRGGSPVSRRRNGGQREGGTQIMKDYRRLNIWVDSMAYCKEIYEFIKALPPEEGHNLSDQLRRAVVSIRLNFAESAGCETEPEVRRFLWYVYRSIHEVITCLEIAKRLRLAIDQSGLTELIDHGDKLAAMVYRFIQPLRPSDRGEHKAGSGTRVPGSASQIADSGSRIAG